MADRPFSIPSDAEVDPTAELERALTVEVLGILGRVDDPSKAAALILSAVRRTLGLEAAAIRLAQEDDFTYTAHEGFPEAFIQAENCLRSRGLKGEPLFDDEGRPLFECTCGLVLMGLTDPANPLFTPGGSAWTNDTQPSPDRTAVLDRRVQPRDRCVHSGYRSIALIPIRSGERIVGLLQLNDPRPNRLSLRLVTFLEGLASGLGIALERKRELARLEDSLGSLRLVHEVAKAGSWAWELRTGRNIWSDTLFRLYGLEPGSVEPSFETWSQVLDPEDRAVAVRYAKDTVANGREIEFEWRVRHRDGSVHWLLSRGRPQRDAAGALARYVGVAIDVTERRSAEEALRESQERLSLLIDHAPAALAMFDRDMRYLAVSRRWLDDYGLHGRDYLGRSHYELFPEITDAWRAIHVRGLAGEVIRNEEDRFVRADGAVQWLRWEVLPWQAGDGTVGGIVIFSEDITARHDAEAERHRLERELNHLQRLESLGRLAGGISHDMNNVLGAIMAVSSILKERFKDDPRVSHEAEVLLQAAVRGRDLVKGLRDFSRKELDSATELDLNALARQEADLLERTMLKKVEISLDLQDDLPPVFGEGSSLSNALMNLCVNACDAMPHGGVITLITRSQRDGFVELAVQDDGEGMPPEVLARALEPFFTTKPIGKGTGLGLSQVFGTVKAHGGSLDIQSEPGKGTRVSMAFPPVPSRAQAFASAAPEGGEAAKALEVLLVDDEEMIRSTVQTLFQALGHRCQSSSSGPDALRRIEAGARVDLVVLDLNMPGMDGEEALGRLRALRPDLPVLFVTGYGDGRIPAILKRFPRVRILNKPFSVSELQELLFGWP